MPWLCEWCRIYGKFPVCEAYRPDDEEPVITAEGDNICKSCYDKWRAAKEQAQKETERERKKVRS